MERKKRKALAHIFVPIIVIGLCFIVDFKVWLGASLGYLFGYWLCMLTDPNYSFKIGKEKEK